MKKLFAGLALACSMAVSLPALAQVDEAAARNLMQEAGTWRALGDIPVALRQGMQQGMGQAGGMLPPDMVQGLLKAVEASFTAERFQASGLAVVSKGLDAATVTEVRKWTGSALGQKVIAAEKAASPGEAAKLATAGQAELQKADDARRKALSDIVEATKAIDQVAEVSLITAVAMVRGLAAANPAMAQGMPPEDQLRAMMQGQMSAARPQMQNQIMGSLAATFASLSTAELQQYATYLRSPAGAKLNDLTLSAVAAALKDGATEFGKQMSGAMKPAAG